MRLIYWHFLKGGWFAEHWSTENQNQRSSQFLLNFSIGHPRGLGMLTHTCWEEEEVQKSQIRLLVPRDFVLGHHPSQNRIRSTVNHRGGLESVQLLFLALQIWDEMHRIEATRLVLGVGSRDTLYLYSDSSRYHSCGNGVSPRTLIIAGIIKVWSPSRIRILISTSTKSAYLSGYHWHTVTGRRYGGGCE